MARLRLGTAGLSLWVFLYIPHLVFHLLSSFHYIHRLRLSPSSETAGIILRHSLFCLVTRFASWAHKQKTQTKILRILKYTRPGQIFTASQKGFSSARGQFTTPPAPHLQHHSLTSLLHREQYRTVLLLPWLTHCYSSLQWMSLLSAKDSWPFPPFLKLPVSVTQTVISVRMKLVSQYCPECYQEESSTWDGI